MRRRADEPRQHRRLGKVQGSRLLAEVTLRRGVDPIGPRPEIGGIEVPGQDLIFAQPRFEPQRDNDFLHLAPQRAFRGKIAHPHQLLGYRAGTFEPAAAVQIVPGRACNAVKIDPVMRVEPAILDRDHGMDQICRQRVDPDPIVLSGSAGCKDLTPGGSEDDRRTGLVRIAAARNRQSEGTIADEGQSQQRRSRAGPLQADQDRTRTSSRRLPHTLPNLCRYSPGTKRTSPLFP